MAEVKKIGVKLKTIMAGPDGNHSVGEVLLLDEDQARTLIEGGFATAEGGIVKAEIMEKLAGTGEHETTAIEPPETTSPSEGRKRRAGSKKKEG